MRKTQSDRLSRQQEEGQGPVTIFHHEAMEHDHDVGRTSYTVLDILTEEYPQLKFRYKKILYKAEINDVLQQIDPYLGQTLFVDNASIKPDGGILQVKDDYDEWRVILVTEAKHQGKDIENISKGILVGKNKDQDLMAAGNAIERVYKNIKELANYMLAERYFPYVVFLEGSNFLTRDVIVERPDGRRVTLTYNNSFINRIDRVTAANYGMPINTNLCENIFVESQGTPTMLQAASIFTKGEGGHWDEDDMIDVMLDVAHTSLRMLGSDLFNQLTKK